MSILLSVGGAGGLVVLQQALNPSSGRLGGENLHQADHWMESFRF